MIGAINVSAPSFRFDDRLEEAAPILVEAAAAIGMTLGSPHLV